MAPPLPTGRRLGRRGERLAARALRRAGYRILARNVRTPRGEVDLLALEGEVLVVVEVKAFGRRRRTPAEARLGGAQRRRLRRAGWWLAGRPGLRGRTLRFDLAFVHFDSGSAFVTIRRSAF